MSRDAVDAVPRAADDAPAQEDMRDESPLGGGSVIANEQVIAESGGEQDRRSAGDDAKQAVEPGGSLISQTEDPGGRNMNVKASEHMDVEDERNTEAARSSEMDGDGEDAGSQNTSDAASVTVDPAVKYHANWEAWQNYFVDYCRRTLQVIPVKETMSCAERNKRLKKTKRGVDEDQLVPTEFDPYQRTYICTHGWKKRKSRSEGSRPRQHVRLTRCPFRFVVQWNLARGELQVKNGVWLHNHQVSPAAFATYPSSRGVFHPLVGARVQGMLEVGAKRSRIYDYLLEHDENVMQADVDNLVRDYSSSMTNVDDNEETARELALFAAVDPENLLSVADTDCGETGVISIASAHMRLVFARFSEVLLLIAAIRRIGAYNYQLLTFMGMNEFGEGAVVQQSLIEANGDWHMERAIDHFKRFHPTRIDLLQVIVVDKDLNEIRVLEANFPAARILLRHFHVIKYLKEMRSKPEFGKISSDDASQVDAAVHKMVYASSEHKYKEAHESLKGFCERCGIDRFFKYFEKNWHSCTDRWVYYLRATLPHFNNHTNNRLESYFGKLKEGIDSLMSMANCIKALVAFDRRKQNDYEYRLTRIGRFSNSNYDEEMSTVLRFTTHYAARQIERQYILGLENASMYNFEKDPEELSVVKIGGIFKTHALRTDDWKCNCEFAASMGLPCRHAIAYRKYTNVRTHSERYTEAVRATHLIASEIADIEDEAEFESMLQFVMSQWRNVRQKKIAEDIPEGDLKEALKMEDRHAFSDADLKWEFEISSSDDEECCTGDAANSDANTEKNPPASSVSIRLNPKARKVGAPKKAKKKIVAGERADRKWYEAAKEGRNKSGEVTLLAVVNSLDHVQPGLREVQRRLSGIIVKYGDAESKKPKLHMMKNPVLIQDPFYLLPTKLLEACIKILPVSNSKEDAITIDTSQTSQPTEEKTGKLVETIVIKDQVKEDGVDTVLLPLNFDNFHWCCVVVKANAKRIYYYDPLNHASYKNACNAVGTHLKILGLLDYDVIAMNNPIQFDEHSCGVFVGWMFICQAISHDTMEDDDKEEKTPAPRNTGDDDAGDEVQHTQRAARIEDAEDEVSPTQRAAGVDDAKSEVLPTQPAQ
ncbi:hypothetical protein PPTG_03223 [Phytophthora nicotianae INRA-310]|uniref:SWIM-type domain-containing protein n=4 Tax=Phytophthora nicotianae TaxID=4792 RepID=W2R6K3_PHYN3|nr:hypothetical protein PPTG_03223 [Phytophthora nicotianae INRA-310]ETN20155.1 hypothetical protein PPTG_03223 [Phytophthora nicotianae INRA-310]